MKTYMTRPSVLLTVAGVVALVSAGPAVSRACFMRSPQPVQVWLDHIHVDITDQVAVKTYNCTFKNPNPRAVVGGVCYMELEPGAQVDNTSVLVDGKEMKAEILDVKKANKVFTDMVKQGGSPALLEYFGNQLIQTQIPRIKPNGTVTVKLTYTTVLQSKGGLVRLQMLNTNPKALMQPLKSASVTVNIKSTAPIKNLYSPTHKIKIVEKEGWDVAAEWSQENYLPKHPFVLYYDTGDEAIGASLVAHREIDEQGAFMLMLSPTLGTGVKKVTESQILPKDVVFCVDTSGSMLQGKKMEQARAALAYCIESLREGDRFNIVNFSTVARNFHDGGLVELTDESRSKALRYIRKLNARGGTAIQEALDLSLKHLGKSDRLKMILFATDGLPTIGERNPQQILTTMEKKNTDDVRMFVFGEGFDVNTKLLDFLALNNRGEADYILPDENITEKISRFFDRVGSPIMTDLELTFAGLEVTDVFPRKISDVYRGEQVIVFGRYNGHGLITVKLTGSLKGERVTIEYPLEFPEYSRNDRNAFVPRLWAGKKVNYLLSEIRKSNMGNEELVDEVTSLAKQYGIVTPYTGFLMADDIVAKDMLQLSQSFRRRFGRLEGAQATPAFGGAGFGVPASEEAKKEKVQLSSKLADLKRDAGRSGAAESLDEAADFEYQKYGGKSSALAVLRHIGARTFYKSGPIWYDSRFDPSKHKTTRTVKIGSDAYLKLLDDDTRVAKYLALGEVVLKIGKTWYRIGT
jgi:Ca-activated chloride channel family protein